MSYTELQMRNIGCAGLAILLAVAAPAFAHDMSAMDNMSSTPNAMGAHMHMSEHMKMTELRRQTRQDDERARALLVTLRRALSPYRDYRAALFQGFRIFLPSVPQEVYHFADYEATNAEYQGLFDPERPGALLYVKTGTDDYVLVGAMYSAPASFTPDQLNALIPLSVARWHEHVDICLPRGITLTDLVHDKIGADRTDLPGTLPVAANPEALDLDHRVGFMADGRFGFEGKIHDVASCQSAGGNFIPLAFGWMVHVYPFQGDDLKVSYGMNVPSVSTN
ncbi:MAG TPA: hypothetical protein VKB29_09365 [Candidatus Binataceae bacterium]|nr:hypothetical protein [Candidatus Binataceae bacterium]